MVAEPCSFEVQDGQPATGEPKHKVWNASQDDASFGVDQAEGGVMRSRQGDLLQPIVQRAMGENGRSSRNRPGWPAWRSYLCC